MLTLFGEVDDEMYERTVKYLSRLQEHPVVRIHTEGGDFYTGLAIYDLLKPLNCTLIANGACMSAGVIIYCAGQKRIATPSTQFMIHYGQDSNASTTEAAHNKKMLKLMQSIVADRVNVKKRTVNGWFRADTYLDVERAKEIGLVNG